LQALEGLLTNDRACLLKEPLIYCYTVIPAQAGIHVIQSTGLLVSLTLRSIWLAFNALRAFVRRAPE